jgi:hypothetical protein
MTDQSTIQASFDPRHLRRLRPFVAEHDIRYYLCGICIEPAPQGGIYLIATNGHAMAIVHDESGTIAGADQIIMKACSALYDAGKEASRTSEKCRVLVEGSRVRIAVDSTGEFFVQAGDSLIEAKFPDWRKVLPAFEKLERGALRGNPVAASLLGRVAKAAGKWASAINLWQGEPGTSIVAQVDSIPELLIILMPISSDKTEADYRKLFERFARPPMEGVGEADPVREVATEGEVHDSQEA